LQSEKPCSRVVTLDRGLERMVVRFVRILYQRRKDFRDCFRTQESTIFRREHSYRFDVDDKHPILTRKDSRPPKQRHRCDTQLTKESKIDRSRPYYPSIFREDEIGMSFTALTHRKNDERSPLIRRRPGSHVAERTERLEETVLEGKSVGLSAFLVITKSRKVRPARTESAPLNGRVDSARIRDAQDAKGVLPSGL
jgi:hypothetical protein